MCNLCFRSGLEIVREEECSNDVKALKKAFKAALKVLGASVDEVLVCAEYTGRYIYPLTVASQELGIFLWMDDPTRIKNSPESPNMHSATATKLSVTASRMQPWSP